MIYYFPVNVTVSVSDDIRDARLTLRCQTCIIFVGYLDASGYTGMRFIDSPFQSDLDNVSESAIVNVTSDVLDRVNFDPNNNICYNVITKVC